MAEEMNVENNISAQRAAFLYEYRRRPDVMEKAREISLRKSKERKVLTTMGRFEEHSYEELMHIVAMKCAQKGVEYDVLKEDFARLIHILHDPM